MFAALTPELRLNPFAMYAQLRSQAPVVYLSDYNIWLVTRYDDVRTVLTDHARFSSEYAKIRPKETADPAVDASMIAQDPPRHTLLRGLVSKAFTPRAIADLEPRIREITDHLLDRVVASGQMEVMADLAVPLPVTVIAELLGIPASDQERFKRWSDNVIVSADSFLTEQVSTEVLREKEEMYAYFRDVIGTRRLKPGTDLISQLLQVDLEGERLTEDDVLSFCWLLLVAGNETTTSLIGNAVLTLLENPEAVATLKARPDLIPAAVEEVLRYRSPAQMMFRVATREVELGGQRIQPGQRVVALIGSANRDPDRFDDPDRFNVTRDPNPHLAFGHGIHFCLGAPLARLEAKVALTALLERIDQMERANDDPLEPVRGFLVMGLASLPIRFRPVDQASRASSTGG